MLKHHSPIKYRLVSLMTLAALMGTSQAGFAMDPEEQRVPSPRTTPVSLDREACRKLATEYQLGEEDQILQAIQNLGENRADLLKKANEECFFRFFHEDWCFESRKADPDVKNIPPSMNTLEALESLNSIKHFGDDLPRTLGNLNSLTSTFLFPVFKDEFGKVATAARQIGSIFKEGDTGAIFDSFCAKYKLTRIFSDEFLYLIDVIKAFGDKAHTSLLEDFKGRKIYSPNDSYSHFFQELDEFCAQRLGSAWTPRGTFEERPYKAMKLDDNFIETYIRSFVPICESRKADRRHKAVIYEFVNRPEIRQKSVQIAQRIFGDESPSYRYIQSWVSGIDYYDEVDGWLKRTAPFSSAGQWPQISEFTSYPLEAFRQATAFVEENKINERWNNCNFARDQLKTIMRYIRQQKQLPTLEEVNSWIERDRFSNTVSKETVTIGVKTYL